MFAELAHVKRNAALGGVTFKVIRPWNFERLFHKDGANLGGGKERGKRRGFGETAACFGESVTRVGWSVDGASRESAREVHVVAEGLCGAA